jgi:hypothetical protein
MEQQTLYPVFAFGKWGLVNREGDQVVPIQYRVVRECRRDSEWSLETNPLGAIGDEIRVNSFGEEMPKSAEDEEEYEELDCAPFSPEWEAIVAASAKNNILVPRHRWDNLDYTDEEGNVIEDFFDSPSYFSDGLIACYNKLTKKWGFMNIKGEVIIPPQWDSVGTFYGGYATVAVNDDKAEPLRRFIDFRSKYSDDKNEPPESESNRERCGIIDKQGKLAIPLMYDYVWNFDKYGLARVAYSSAVKWKYPKMGVIDKANKIVIPPIYDHIGCFRDGLAWARKGPYWGYIDIHGNEVLPVEQDFDYAAYLTFALQCASSIPLPAGTVEERCGKRVVIPDYGDMEVHFEKWKPVITNARIQQTMIEADPSLIEAIEMYDCKRFGGIYFWMPWIS